MSTDQRAISIKMDSETNNIFTKKASLLAMLDQQQSKSYDLEQIGLVLGGPQKILRNYLSSNDISLNDDQLTQIEQIITSQTQIPIESTPKSIDKINNSQSITYTFNSDETYFHYLFEKQTATTIVNTVYHIRFVTLALCLTVSGWIIWYIRSKPWHYLYSLMIRLCTFLFCIVFFLTTNRKIFQKSIGHFVFWFKILISVQNAICLIILKYWIGEETQPERFPMLIKLYQMLGLLQLNLIILMFCAVDCFHISRKLKIFIGFVISILLTLYAFQITFRMDDEIISRSTIHFTSWLRLSVASLCSSSAQVLCIFLWKQSILLFIKKGKCINIRYTPYIKWS